MKAEFQEQLVFTNDFKIRFCNAYHALQRHAETCSLCAGYLRNGDEDLCVQGKRAIIYNMTLQESSVESGVSSKQ